MTAAAAIESDLVPVEVTNLEPRKLMGDLRWTGKAKFPGALRGRSVVIFQIQGEMVAIPSFCPHEQANLAEAIFVSPWVLQCPLHQNQYDLRTGAISTFKVEMHDDKPCLVWDKGRREAVAFAFSAEVPVDERSDDEKVALLEAEIRSLREAAQIREEKVVGTIRQMDGMIREVEEKRAAIERANERLTAANELIQRVTDTMREVLLVLDPRGRIQDANRRFCDLSGYDLAELRGEGLERVLSAPDLARFQEGTAGRAAELECDLLPKHGDPSPHLFRSAVLYGPSGKKEGVVVVGTDIRQIRAAQRELSAAYEKVTGLLDNMRQAVFVVVAGGTIVEPVSRFSATVFGGDIVGRDVFDVVYRDLDRKSEAFSLLRTAFLTTFGADDFQWDLMEGYFPRRLLLRQREPAGKDEGTGILKIDYCPLRGPDGTMEKMMLVVEDITRLENLEREIEREKQSNLRRIGIVEELAKNKLDDLKEIFSSAYAVLREARLIAEAEHPNPEAVAGLLRGLHTLKGNARMLGLRLIAQEVHAAEDAAVAFAPPGAPNQAARRLREAADSVQRQVAEYCHLAETVLHIPNEFDARSRLLLHRRTTALDRIVSALLVQAPSAAPVADDARAALGRALEEVKSAAAGVISEDLHACISEVESMVGAPGPDKPALRPHTPESTQSADLTRWRRAHAALLDSVAALCTDSNACRAYSLSKTRWVELFVALHDLTALALQPGSAGGEALGRARQGVLEAAGAVEQEYVESLFTGADVEAKALLAPLREAWRHLAFFSVLESLATVRHADRSLVLEAAACVEVREQEMAHLVGGLRARAGLFASALDALARRGRGPREALGMLSELFGLDHAGDAASLFVSGRDLANLDSVLAAFSEQMSPAAANTLLTQLGASGELYRAGEATGSPYLKRVDVARQLRAVREVLAGNYQLLFERVQLLNVVAFNFHALKDAISRFKNDRTDRAYAEIEGALERLLDVPLVPALYQLRQTVTEIAAQLSKSVDFRIVGDDTIAVPRDRLAVIQDVLGHMVRNALAHGVEEPDEREQSGKGRTGAVEIECAQDSASLVITVRDDGRGIDVERLLRRAESRGSIPPGAAARLTRAEALDLVFLPGVSTAGAVDEVSGRGIGLDAVRAALAGVGGSVAVRSEPGRGTEFIVSVRQGA